MKSSEWLRIEVDEQISDFLNSLEWSETFIREVHLISPSYVNTTGATVAPNCLPCLRILLSTTGRASRLIEMLFVEVAEFGAWLEGELKPKMSIESGRVVCRFHQQFDSQIVSREVRFREVLEITERYLPLYGWEDVFDKGGMLQI